VGSATTKGLPEIPSLWVDDCRLLVETTDQAICLLDTEGRVATWNAGAQRIEGYSGDEIIGHHFSELYPPEEVSAGKPERELAAARDAGRVEDEGWRMRKGGSRFWADVLITALRDERGNLRGYGTVTRDVTRRRAAEQQLLQAEERFRSIVDAITDYAIFMLDTTGHVVTWNPGASRLKGYSATEIIGKSFSVFYTAEDQASGKPQRILETVRRTGRFEDENWRVRKDGSRFWANVVVTLLRDAQGQFAGFAKITRDLTERKKAEQAGRSLLREQEASRVKDEFLASVSHELRTPLNAISGYAQLLRVRPSDTSLIAKASEVIQRSADTQARIIDDLLDMSRIAAGGLRLDLQPTNLVSVVTEAVEAVRPWAAAKGLSIDIHAPAEPDMLMTDRRRLRQVVWHLLSNAIKFTEARGSIFVGVERTDSSVRLSVRDTGRGIEASLLPHVFERFRQADSSTTRQAGGLGLGLAIVRHVVELHGGAVEAKSAGVGAGASFCVTLPARAIDPDALAAPPTTPEEATPRPSDSEPLSGVRILVVDDEEDARDVLRDLLTDAGAMVDTADSAASGFAAVRRLKPDMLISDIGMPGEDGFSLVRRVRGLDADEGGSTPAIALTAYTRDQDRADALEAGFTAHVSKPVNTDALVATVAHLAGFARH
jgi:PAS domain S-box-containing protein